MYSFAVCGLKRLLLPQNNQQSRVSTDLLTVNLSRSIYLQSCFISVYGPYCGEIWIWIDSSILIYLLQIQLELELEF
ncbi:hypothetical protein Ancab_012798 [Ancistrocladus abbreviatus]